MVSARDALQWMESKAKDLGPGILFRGQNRVYKEIKPSITRLDDQTKFAMWTICRRFHTAAAGVTGYSIPSEHDRLAILQHYILRSPVIDLTGTLAIAACISHFLTLKQEANAFVYSVDPKIAALPDVVFSNHDFLILGIRGRRFKAPVVATGRFLCWPGKLARSGCWVQQFDLLTT